MINYLTKSPKYLIELNTDISLVVFERFIYHPKLLLIFIIFLQGVLGDLVSFTDSVFLKVNLTLSTDD